jgi:predicted chitinase
MKNTNTYYSLNEAMTQPGDAEAYAASKGIDVSVKSYKPSELSNGGPVMSELIDILAELEAMTGFQLKVTSGNDVFHKKYKSSNHNKGAAVDFISSSLNNKANRKKMEQAILKLMLSGKYDRNGLRLGAINEYDKPTHHATGGHFHMSLTKNKESRDRYECNLALSKIRSYKDVRKLKGSNVKIEDIQKIDDVPQQNTVVQKGSRGDGVRDIQTTLLGLGYNLGKYGVDGIFGDITLAALIKFQKDNGIPQTGIVDDETKKILIVKTKENPKSQRTDLNKTNETTIKLRNGLVLKILYDTLSKKIMKITSSSSGTIKPIVYGKEAMSHSFESKHTYYTLEDFINEQSIIPMAIDNMINNKNARKNRREERRRHRKNIKRAKHELSDNNILGDNEKISVEELKKLNDINNGAFGLFKLKLSSTGTRYTLIALNQFAKNQLGGKQYMIDNEGDIITIDNLFLNTIKNTHIVNLRNYFNSNMSNSDEWTEASKKYHSIAKENWDSDMGWFKKKWVETGNDDFSKEERSLIYSKLMDKLESMSYSPDAKPFKHPLVKTLNVSLSDIVNLERNIKKQRDIRIDDKEKQKDEQKDKSVVKELNPATGLSYIDDSSKMTSNQKASAKLIAAALQNEGITNPYLIRGILAVVGKETHWKAKPENLNYTKERLPEVWSVFSITGKKVKKGTGKHYYNDLATYYERDPEKLANFVYQEMRNPNSIYFPWSEKKDRRYGNTSPGDGYKYRGAGFNQLTFKGSYKKMQDETGIDLLTKGAEGLTDSNFAAQVLAAFFKSRLNSSSRNLHGAKSLEKIDNQEQANKIAAHANTGWGKDPSHPIASTNKINNVYFA